MRNSLYWLSGVTALMLSLVSPALGDAMGTTFTYQGQLKDQGVPVNATCDFTFGLWEGDVVGSLLETEHLVGVDVTNGLLTVELGFDVGYFEGKARWLEVAVCCAPLACGQPPTNFTTLDPRQ